MTDQTPPSGDNEAPEAHEAREPRRKERHRAVPLYPEIRYFAPTDLELRREQHDDTDVVVLRGAPIVYGRSYSVVDMFGEFRETIHAGALAGVLNRGVDCRLLFNHDGLPMARTSSGTMKLWSTDEALMFEARVDMRQQLANDFVIAIERGDLSQMSVGMIVARDQWGEDGRVETRDIFELGDLPDVSGVTYPCSPTTHLEVAQRMAFSVPIETRARLRRLEVELRAGKVLSGANAQLLADGLAALHALAEAGGVDPNALGPGADEDAPNGHEDGSDASGTSTQADASIMYTDGSGQRSEDDPEVEERADETAEVEEPPEATPGAAAPTMTASTLRLLNEAGRNS